MRFLSNLFSRARSPGEPVRFEKVTPHQLDAAVQSLLSGRHERAQMAQTIAFMQSAKARGLDMMQMRVALHGETVLYAVLPAELPGRSVILISGSPRNARQGMLAKQMISDMVEGYVRADMTMVQSLIDPDDSTLLSLYTSCGFEQLAQLIYLETHAQKVEWQLPRGFSLENYNSQNHPDFATAILASYENSLDCPAMNGVRTIEDIIAGHKAAGEFDPANWLLVRKNEAPAGVLLLARVPGSDALDLVYIGLAAGARGCGVGGELMKVALSRAADLSCKRLTTAVDLRNRPAMQMYFRAGMQRVGSRLALVRVIHRRGERQSTIYPQSLK